MCIRDSPYTIGLMASKPIVGKKVDRLYSIPGKVPNPVNMPNYLSLIHI